MKTFSVEEVIKDIEELFGVKMGIDQKAIDTQIRYMELFSQSEAGIEAMKTNNARELTNCVRRFFEQSGFPYTNDPPMMEETFSIYIKAMGKTSYELNGTCGTSGALIERLKEMKKTFIGASFCVLNPHTKTSLFVKN